MTGQDTEWKMKVDTTAFHRRDYLYCVTYHDAFVAAAQEHGSRFPY